MNDTRDLWLFLIGVHYALTRDASEESCKHALRLRDHCPDDLRILLDAMENDKCDLAIAWFGQRGARIADGVRAVEACGKALANEWADKESAKCYRLADFAKHLGSPEMAAKVKELAERLATIDDERKR